MLAFADVAELESVTIRDGPNVVARAESEAPAAMSKPSAIVAANTAITFKVHPRTIASRAVVVRVKLGRKNRKTKGQKPPLSRPDEMPNPRGPSDFIPQP